MQYCKIWYIINMKWDIEFTNRAAKQAQRLDERVLLALQVLVDNLKTNGPAPGRFWCHYGKLHGKKQEARSRKISGIAT